MVVVVGSPGDKRLSEPVVTVIEIMRFETLGGENDNTTYGCFSGLISVLESITLH